MVTAWESRSHRLRGEPHRMGMSEDQSKETEETEGKGATFDMYHFFSRKDVLLAGAVILLLLLYVLFQILKSGPVV